MVYFIKAGMAQGLKNLDGQVVMQEYKNIQEILKESCSTYGVCLLSAGTHFF